MKALSYLLSREWSMGNGQCPECHGVPASWYPHPCYLTPDTIGHKHDCVLAASLKELGEEPLYKGGFKSDEKYRNGISEEGIYCVVPEGTPLNEKEIVWERALEQWRDEFNASVIKIIMESAK